MEHNSTGLQQIRLSSVSAQLAALSSQAQVIQRLSTEHNESIDLGIDPEVGNILRASRELQVELGKIVDLQKKRKGAAVLKQLDKIIRKTNYIEDCAKKFIIHAGFSARTHLAEILGVSAVNAEGVIPELVKNPESAISQAGQSCFSAETNQTTSFLIQVHALTSLALEIGYFAASETNL